MSCSRANPNLSPLGERFPQVRTETLSGEEVALPDNLEGEPAILLIGYVQNAQFDIDRWLLGLSQAQTPGRLLEVPTIRGMVPRMISGQINEGMRRGIPEEDWGVVATAYRDADKIIEFLGNENPNNARVVLLDERGNVVWIHDRGYSAGKLLELDALARERLENGMENTPRSGDESSSDTDRTDESWVESFKRKFNEIDSSNIDLIDEIYASNAIFEDPIHRITGLDDLRDYFSRMYEGVASCEFIFGDTVIDGDMATLTWTMRMQHKRFRPKETLELPGITLVKAQDGKIVHHRDYFDLGAMIYERVPVLGAVVRGIRGRL